jgi:iron complex transport system ATP-binding protein
MTSSMPHAFDLEHVSVRFGSTTAVDDVTLDLPHGRVTSIIGPNGSGKSTLLRALARLAPTHAGRIALDGSEVQGFGARDFARRVAVLPQSPVAPDELTVIDLVSRGRDPHRRWYDQWSLDDETIVRDSLRLAGLEDLADRALHTLSGGQRQRAWIALTLAQRTDVLLLDEPTTYLDIGHQLEVLETVRRLHDEERKTIVMVLHDLNMAGRFSDHLVAMRAGRIIEAGAPHDVLTPAILLETFGVRCEVRHDAGSEGIWVIPLETA